MKSLVRVAAFAALTIMLSLAACTEDVCKTNPPTCKSGAGCSNGACVCPAGFEGSDCGDTLRNPFFLRRKKLASSTSTDYFRDSSTTYRGVETNLSVVPNTVDTITVTVSSVSAYNKIAVTNLGNNVGNPYYLEALVSSGAKFYTTSFQLTPTTNMTSVLGKLVGTELSASYSIQSNVPGVAPINLTFKGLRQ